MLRTKSLTLPPDFSLCTFDGRNDEQLLNRIGELRAKVWRSSGYPTTLNPSVTCWLDSEEDRSTHFAISLGSELVAACRLGVYSSVEDLAQGEWFNALTERPPPPMAFTSRLVVDQSVQARGLGHFLDTTCIDTARAWGAASVFCDVPEYRIAGLRRMGFVAVQECKTGVVFPTLRWAAMLLKLKEM